MPKKLTGNPNKSERRKRDPKTNQLEVRNRERYEAGSKQVYADNRRILMESPAKIKTLFNKSYTLDPVTKCHVWTAKTKDGKLSTTSQNDKGVPRFGPGTLSTEETANARQYIYNTTYPYAKIPKHGHIKMDPKCNKYCVNPAHMWPKPPKKKDPTT